MKLKEYPSSIKHTSKLLVSTKQKLLSNSEKKIPLVVSLTTIRPRLKKVIITIKSILNQSNTPEKIILWINEKDKKYIPKKLKKLEGDIFQIRTTHLYCSHKKLVHSLKLFPNKAIITCDDDFIYDKDWLKLTYNEHLQNPNKVIANRVRYINYNNDKLEPYKKWVIPNNSEINVNCYLPIGANGVLYPVNCFNEEVFNEKLFLKLTPKADDLWFKAMSFINNTVSIPSSNPPKPPIPIAATQRVSLKKHNVDKDHNSIQWKNVSDYYNINL